MPQRVCGLMVRSQILGCPSRPRLFPSLRLSSPRCLLFCSLGDHSQGLIHGLIVRKGFPYVTIQQHEIRPGAISFSVNPPTDKFEFSEVVFGSHLIRIFICLLFHKGLFVSSSLSRSDYSNSLTSICVGDMEQASLVGEASRSRTFYQERHSPRLAQDKQSSPWAPCVLGRAPRCASC